MMLTTIIVFLLILSILVLIHELGHFLTAKKFGIKVEEFGFGFPPRIFGKKIGETIYSLNLLPIGGFVKLYGEDEAGMGKISSPKSQKSNPNPKDLDRAFYARPIWQRFIVVVAGVVMNFVLAVVIVSYIFTAHGAPTLDNKVVISEIVKGSPAEASGLRRGEIVYKINGQGIETTDELIKITKENAGREIILLVGSKEKGAEREISITPRREYPKGEGPMGIAVAPSITVKKYAWYQAPIEGTKEATRNSLLILSGLGTVVKDLVSQRDVPQGVAGPVGIAQLTGEFVKSGPLAVLSFTAVLSLNLAVLNILPIPALDGGRLFFIIIEAVTRRKVNPKHEAYAHAVGIALLLALIAVLTLHDFLRIFQGIPILPE